MLLRASLAISPIVKTSSFIFMQILIDVKVIESSYWVLLMSDDCNLHSISAADQEPIQVGLVAASEVCLETLPDSVVAVRNAEVVGWWSYEVQKAAAAEVF